MVCWDFGKEFQSVVDIVSARLEEPWSESRSRGSGLGLGCGRPGEMVPRDARSGRSSNATISFRDVQQASPSKLGFRCTKSPCIDRNHHSFSSHKVAAMEGRLLRLERHYQYEKESTVPWQIKNNPDRLGIALSDAQIPANPAYLFTNDMKDPTRAKREHLIDYLSDLLAENRFQAKDGQGGAWTEWYVPSSPRRCLRWLRSGNAGVCMPLEASMKSIHQVMRRSRLSSYAIRELQSETRRKGN